MSRGYDFADGSIHGTTDGRASAYKATRGLMEGDFILASLREGVKCLMRKFLFVAGLLQPQQQFINLQAKSLMDP